MSPLQKILATLLLALLALTGYGWWATDQTGSTPLAALNAKPAAAQHPAFVFPGAAVRIQMSGSVVVVGQVRYCVERGERFYLGVLIQKVLA